MGSPSMVSRYPWIDIRQMENEKFIMLNKGSRLRYVTDKVLKNHSMDPKTDRSFLPLKTIWELVSKILVLHWHLIFNIQKIWM